MCEPHVLSKIEDILEKKMIAGEMFTAFDITLSLQIAGIDKNHREIRKDIQKTAGDLMWRYSYQRSLIDLNGIGERALLYYPSGADIRTYLPSPWKGRKNKSRVKRNIISIPSRLSVAAYIFNIVLDLIGN